MSQHRDAADIRQPVENCRFYFFIVNSHNLVIAETLIQVQGVEHRALLLQQFVFADGRFEALICRGQRKNQHRCDNNHENEGIQMSPFHAAAPFPASFFLSWRCLS